MPTLLKEFMIYGFGDFVFKFIGYASFLIYARMFTIEEFGILSLVGTLGGLIGIFQELGLNNATQRFYFEPKMPENQRSLLVGTSLTILLIWSLMLTGIALIILYPLSHAIEKRYEVLWIFIVLTLLSNIPLQILSYSQNLLRIYFSPWKFTFLSFFKNVVSLSLSLIFIVVFGLGLVGYFWGTFSALVISIPLSLWFIQKDLKFRYDKNMAKKVIGFGYPFIFVGLAYWLFGSMDRWMLSELSNNTEVGLYSVANKFATGIFFLTEVFGRAWPPFALKAYADNPNYKYTYSRTFSYWFFCITFVGVVMSIFGLEIIQFSTPQGYWKSTNTLSVLSMGIVLASTTQITAIGISLEQRTNLFFICSWITAGINLLLNIILIPEYGALGASIATFISYAVLSICYLYWTQKLHPIPLEIKKLSLSALIILFTLSFSFFINSLEWNIQIFILKIIFCCLVMSSGFYIFRLSDLRKLIKREDEAVEKY